MLVLVLALVPAGALLLVLVLVLVLVVIEAVAGIRAQIKKSLCLPPTLNLRRGCCRSRSTDGRSMSSLFEKQVDCPAQRLLFGLSFSTVLKRLSLSVL